MTINLTCVSAAIYLCLFITASWGDDASEMGPREQMIGAHSQAWTQCTPFLNKYLSHAERHDTSSTSKAALLAAADKSGTSASISSALAAELYNLDILAADIEEVRGNTTRFLILRNLPAPSPSNPDPSTSSLRIRTTSQFSANPLATPGPPWKTMILFTISHSDPGALARALGVFGKHRINLTSINARPSGEPDIKWHYVFFIEFWGVWFPQNDFKSQEDITAALEELNEVVSMWKWLGCWKTSDDEVTSG